MTKATTSLPSTPLVETCLPVESYFFNKRQLANNVVETHLALRIHPSNDCLETMRRGAGGHGLTPAERPAAQPGPPGNPDDLHSSSSSMLLGCGLA
jgi:hypothetical protein